MKRNCVLPLIVMAALLVSCESTENILGRTLTEKKVSRSDVTFFDQKNYDRQGRLVSENWDDGYKCVYSYSESGDLVSSRQNTGIVTRYTRVDENTVVENWPDDFVKTYVYEDGHLVKEYFGGKDNYIEYFYNDMGQEDHFTSSSGKTSWNEYSPENLLVFRYDSEGNEYFYDYTFWQSGRVKCRRSYKKK